MTLTPARPRLKPKPRDPPSYRSSQKLHAISPTPPPSPPSDSSGHIAGIAVAAVITVSAASLMWYCFRRRRKEPDPEEEAATVLTTFSPQVSSTSAQSAQQTVPDPPDPAPDPDTITPAEDVPPTPQVKVQMPQYEFLPAYSKDPPRLTKVVAPRPPAYVRVSPTSSHDFQHPDSLC